MKQFIIKLKQHKTRKLIYFLTCLLMSAFIWLQPITESAYNSLGSLALVCIVLIRAILALLVFGLGVHHLINWYRTA
jgi:hypothetical protein